MKVIISSFFLLISISSFAQWVNNADNSTTGSLWIGSSVNDSYSQFTIRGPNMPFGVNSKRDIIFDFAAAGKSYIRSYRGYSWDTHLQFLTTSQDGGAAQVRMHLDSEGKVGIGTTSPRGKFDVAANGDVYLSYDPEGSSSQSLFLPGHIYISPYNGSNVSYLNARRPSNTGTTALRLRTYNSGTLTEAMHIEGNGNVGIGTTSPNHNLEVTNNSGTPTLGLRGNLNSKIIFEPVDGSDRFTISANMDPMTWNDRLNFSAANANDILTLKGDGFVGIGTVNPDTRLTVKGVIHTNEVRVDINAPIAPDYVFEKDYDLLSLTEVETYITQNRHLPEVPSAKEMEANGLNLKEMNLLLLKKVEELTLHLIQKEKQMEKLEKRIEQLEK